MVQMFGAMLAESILAVVPHRHFTFMIPKMLRPYFRFQCGLLKQLCRIAHQCVCEFLRDAFGDAGGVGNAAHDGVSAIVMAIHTFGEYLDFYPHLHALVADGLFDGEGRFHVMRADEDGGDGDAHLKCSGSDPPSKDNIFAMDFLCNGATGVAGAAKQADSIIAFTIQPPTSINDGVVVYDKPLAP